MARADEKGNREKEEKKSSSSSSTKTTYVAPTTDNYNKYGEGANGNTTTPYVVAATGNTNNYNQYGEDGAGGTMTPGASSASTNTYEQNTAFTYPTVTDYTTSATYNSDDDYGPKGPSSSSNYDGGGSSGGVASVGTSTLISPNTTTTTKTIDPFATSDLTNEYLLQLLEQETGGPGDYSESQEVQDWKKKLEDLIASKPAAYQESQQVKDALAKLTEVENGQPAAYESKYEGVIDQLLNQILNREKFNIQTDTNYNTLYNLAKQTAMQNGSKAMRDTMGSAQAATGGYGSTYAQNVGSQAYDTYLQSLNDNNVSLAQLAYNMYADDVSGDYNKLSAYQNQDNTNYSRYRDTVNDWQNNRSYYANRYDTERNYDYGQYRDTVSDWQTDRDFTAGRYDTERNYDYGQYRDKVNDWQTDRSYYANQYNNSFNNDLGVYEYENNMNYQLNRDAVSDADDIYTKALALVQQGQSVPESYASVLGDDVVARMNNIANNVNSKKNGSVRGSSGGSSSSSSSSTKTTKQKDTTPTKYDYYESMDKAYESGDTEAYDKLVEELISNYGKSDPTVYSYYKRSRGIED